MARQAALYERGEEVVQETYDCDAATGQLTPHRAKEEADDYRYFPEPDLVPLEPDRELVERLRGELPEAPWARIERLKDEIGFALAEGLVTTGRDDLFARTPGDRRAVANVLMNEFAALDENAADPAALAKAIEHRADVSPDTFREALVASVSDPASIDAVLSNRAVSDLDELDPVIDRILSEHESQVAAYRGGKEGLLGFFVGQVMKETGGKASPQVVNERLREKLKA